MGNIFDPFTSWWNLGKDSAANLKSLGGPENSAKFKNLISNDWAQRQISKIPKNIPFLGGKEVWNPLRGFVVQDAVKGGLKSGPTPLVRQAFSRLSLPATVGSGAYGLTNAAIDTQTADNIGLGRNDMYKYGANFANTDLGKNIFNYGSNLASNWNDFNTNPVNRYGVKNTNLFNSSTFTGTQDLAQAQAQAARNQAVQQSINPVANVPQAQYEASMDNTYKNVATGGGNTGYTGQGSQSRAGVNRPSAPAPVVSAPRSHPSAGVNPASIAAARRSAPAPRQAPVYHTIRNRGGR